jgi:hypothetical protein
MQRWRNIWKLTAPCQSLGQFDLVAQASPACANAPAMPQARNQSRDKTAVNLDAAAYDVFVKSYGKRTAQESLTRLVRWFNSLPVDAREAILSDMSPAAKEAVLKLAIKQLRVRRRRP